MLEPASRSAFSVRFCDTTVIKNRRRGKEPQEGLMRSLVVSGAASACAVFAGFGCNSTTPFDLPSTDSGGLPEASVVAPEASITPDAGVDAAPDVVVACTPGDKKKGCYSGPPGTLGVGTCVAGTQTCADDATWGPCVGEVDPSPDVCGGPDSNCDGKLPPQTCPGDVSWQYETANYTHQGEDVYDIQVDPNTRHLVMIGDYEQTVDFGLGPMSCGAAKLGNYILEIDATGKPVAQRNLGVLQGMGGTLSIDNLGNRFIEVTVPADGSADVGDGPITGPADSNGRATVIAKYDPTGAFVWKDVLAYPPEMPGTFSGPSVHGVNGRLFATAFGYWYGGPHPYDVGCGPSTAQGLNVFALDNASCTWQVHLDPNIDTSIQRVDAYPSMAVQSSGNLIFITDYDGLAVATLGGRTFQPAGKARTLIVSMDPTGHITWLDDFPDPDLSVADVAVGPSDEIYVWGVSAAPSLDLGGGPMPIQSQIPAGIDFVLARFDATGHHVWSKRITGNTADWVAAERIVAGPTAIFVVGQTREGQVDFGGGPVSPAFVASLDLDGNHRWSVSKSLVDQPYEAEVSGTSYLYTVNSNGRVEQLLY
jgi:hypothetical protein